MAHAVPMPAIRSTISAVCYDNECGTVLKVGTSEFVQRYTNAIRDRYASVDDEIVNEIGKSISVVTGPFSNEELETIRDCTGWILRSHTLSDPRFTVS